MLKLTHPPPYQFTNMNQTQSTPIARTVSITEPATNTSQGGHETRYITFLTKKDVKTHFEKIESQALCYQHPIYNTFRMKGYWRVGKENVRIRTWAVGYFECKVCETLLGIHDDSANLTNIRQIAGEKLTFENDEKRRKFQSRKWNPASMKTHCCESICAVENASGTLLETPGAGSSSKRKRRFVGSNEISVARADSLKDSQTLLAYG